MRQEAQAVQHRLSWVREDALESPLFYDVTINFPDAEARTLHANSRLLAAASPYLATLLAAGFKETASRRPEIEATEAPFDVYRDVLLWIHTGHINFAEATDAFPPSDLPVPSISTPQSIYRLADFLELPELKSLALASIMSRINVANVVEELMSDLCAHYKPVQEGLIKFAVKNWSDVKESEGWEELERKVEQRDGDVPDWGMEVCMRLLQNF
ncbi:hypothetical protein RQP46_010668 [Phenoliferia psychrophenolica]